MAFQINPQLIRDALAKATNELPPLPNVLVKVLQLTENSDAGTVSEIETLIRSDQAISSKLLRVVNSAYFGLSGQVSSVSQAVVILGYQQVRNLVLSVSMLSGFSTVGAKGKAAQQNMWEVAFGTASAAQIIARKKRLDTKEQEMSFMGGLLQNIGGLFMLSTISRTYISVLEETENSGALLADIEKLRIDCTHAEVGGTLMEKWKLPQELLNVVVYHEDPSAAPESYGPIYVVHIADRLATAAAKTDGEIDIKDLKIDPAALAWLGWSDEELTWAVGEVREKIGLVVELIGGLGGV